MTGSILDRIGTNRGSQPKEPTEAELLDDVGSFGFLRAEKDRAVMLELRMRDGRVTALAYAWLDLATLDPSEGIVLGFGGRKVTIKGRNLQAEVRPNVRLFQALVRHRVPWLQEADEHRNLEAPKGAMVIEEIKIA